MSKTSAILLSFIIGIFFLFLLLSMSLIKINIPVYAASNMITGYTKAATTAIPMHIIIHFKRCTANLLSLYLRIILLIFLCNCISLVISLEIFKFSYY